MDGDCKEDGKESGALIFYSQTHLLVLSYLFDVNFSEIVVSSNIEIKIYNAEKTA